MKKGQSKRPAVIDAGDRKALTEFLSKGGQVLLPLLEVVERTQGAIDEVIDVVGRATVEAVLQLSGEQLAGPKVQGRLSERDVYWYGRQQGEIVLSDRKLKVMKPRLRRRGIGAGGEVDIPAYVRIREGGVADHVVRLMMRGVSTRNYEPALRRMADTAGVSKSSVSREWIEASSAQLDALQARLSRDTKIPAVRGHVLSRSVGLAVGFMTASPAARAPSGGSCGHRSGPRGSDAGGGRGSPWPAPRRRPASRAIPRSLCCS